MRGIYIKESEGDKVTGFHLSFRSNYPGKWVVQTFTRCSLDRVVSNASEVIHDPDIYYLKNERKGTVCQILKVSAS
jgi:hypothetical protein